MSDRAAAGAEWLRRGLRTAAAAGITSLGTAPLNQTDLDILAAMDATDFTLRVEARLAPGTVAPPGRGLLRFGAVGVDLDGPIPLAAAALAEPLVGDSNTQPVREAMLEAACADAEGMDLALDVHVRGDAGVIAATACPATRQIVGADVLPTTDSLPTGTRLVAVPGRFGHDMYWLDDLLGIQRRPRVHAYREMARNGWLGGIASDAPANDVRPMEALRIMFTRRDREGFPLDGWQPQERLAVSDSLAAMMAASPVDAELHSGRPADLVVWSEDPYAGESELGRALAMLVLVEGRVVYSRPLVTPTMDRRQRP
jgi:predicted amidohydrolase YtcJ